MKKKSGARIVLDDRHAVPRNDFVTLKYGTHCNIEYIFGQKASKYIFKYILKGSFKSLPFNFIFRS